ncbi:MAG: hypothetical protein MUF20_09375, partial [Methylotetracoccus sp.]|nr:hypothetical protein [Methylotetracoccus sp.]
MPTKPVAQDGHAGAGQVRERRRFVDTGRWSAFWSLEEAPPRRVSGTIIRRSARRGQRAAADRG